MLIDNSRLLLLEGEIIMTDVISLMKVMPMM